MYVSQRIIDKSIAAIKENPLWQDALEIARKNTYGKIYLVGGQLYRTIAHFLHGTPLPTAQTDFDFLLTEEAKKQWLPVDQSALNALISLKYPNNSWRWKGFVAGGPVGGPYGFHRRALFRRQKIDRNTRPHSATAIHNRTNVKVDLISLKDITPLSDTKSGSYEDYFNAVPLDIQAIAYDFKADRLLGHGINAIQAKTIRWNSKKNLHEIHAPGPYIQQKAMSMTFNWKDDVATVPLAARKCVCPSRTLFWSGCQCGGA